MINVQMNEAFLDSDGNVLRVVAIQNWYQTLQDVPSKVTLQHHTGLKLILNPDMLNALIRIDDFEPNANNNLWAHPERGQFVMLLLTNLGTQDSRTHPVTAVFQHLDDRTIWSRPLVQFASRFSRVAS